MSVIKVLSEEVANRIAAGEVIERPASVVKECVENSIDAGATEIVIKIVNGGRDLIQIVDNGCGMSEDDAFLAFERHGTSKIRTTDDIIHISTLGFRGEALPSIASISRLQIITKTADDDMATELAFSGGKLEYMKKVAANTGTTINIKSIFYNVPARRKFLKTEPVETKHITQYLHHQAVLYPHISFICHQNQREKFSFPATKNTETRLLDIFGTTFSKQNFIPVSNQTEIISLSGYLQDIEPTAHCSLIDAHYLFVNHRFVFDKTIYAAIRAAYDPFIKKYHSFDKGKLPSYILFIDIAPEEIDINVHPAKTEIRFRNINAAYQFVYDTLYQTLLKTEGRRYEDTKTKIASLLPLTPAEQTIARELLATRQTFHRADGINATPIGADGINATTTGSADGINATTTGSAVGINATTTGSAVGINATTTGSAVGINAVYTGGVDINQTTMAVWQQMKIASEELLSLWQLHNTYIFLQTDDGFVLVDQHAAHERIIYEKLLKNIAEKKPNKQKLIFPIVVDLPNIFADDFQELIEQNYEILDNMGFGLKSFSGNSVVIDEIPCEIEYWDGGDIFIDIVRQLKDELTQTKDFRIASAASVACKTAIKAGKKLSKKEMIELVNELFTCEFPFHCPHGRPLIFKMSLTDIEKLFKRIE